MDFWQPFFSLLAAFVLSAFALVRYALGQHRGVVERLVGFLERSMRKQEQLNADAQVAIRQLSDNVSENSRLLRRVAERIGL